MKFLIKNLLGLLLVLTNSCVQGQLSEDKAQEKLKEQITLLNEFYKINIDYNDWSIVSYDEDSCELEFNLLKENKDTTFEFNFVYYKGYESCHVDSNFYYILYYTTSYAKGDSVYTVGYDFNPDTLYYFRTPIENSNDRYYYVGKYYYLAQTMKLTLEQLKFYERHKDSLKKVKGNDLPELLFEK